MASGVLWLQARISANPVAVLERMYDGEDQGIAKASQLVREEPDPESQRLMLKILHQDHQHLQQMQLLIDQYRRTSGVH